MSSIISIEEVEAYVEKMLFSCKISDKENTCSDKVGIELETFPVSKTQTGYDQVSINILHKQLLEVIDEQDHFTLVPHQDTSKPTALFFTNGDSIQLEPGGQLELVMSPTETLQESIVKMSQLKSLISKIGAPGNILFGQQGYQPWVSESKIALQLYGKNNRYSKMKTYFDENNVYGGQMMLQTCSLHVNLDLGPTKELIEKRINVAHLLVPYVSAIFAHSPRVHQGNLLKSYRAFIWQKIDPTRSGILKLYYENKTPSLSEIVKGYTDFVLDAPVIFKRGDTGLINPYETLRSWIMDTSKDFPTVSDLKHHVSLLFPEVRLKGYLELRTSDSPPPGWEFPIVQFYTSILYNEKILDKALALLLEDRSNLKEQMEQSCYGLDSDKLYNTATKLLSLALEGCDMHQVIVSPQINNLRTFVEKYSCQRKTYADDAMIPK